MSREGRHRARHPESAACIAAEDHVEAPAYSTLVALGFEVACDSLCRWTATKENATLSADSPLELLGLAAIYDARGAQWQATDNELVLFVEKLRK